LKILLCLQNSKFYVSKIGKEFHKITILSCEENLFFLVEVNNFKKLPERCLLKAAQKIIQKFLTPNSTYELSVSSSKVKVLLEDISKEIVSVLTFQEICFEVEWSIDSHLKTFKELKIVPHQPREKTSKIFGDSGKRFRSLSGMDSLNSRMTQYLRRFSDQQDSVPKDLFLIKK
jgi:hypothetical protein